MKRPGKVPGPVKGDGLTFVVIDEFAPFDEADYDRLKAILGDSVSAPKPESPQGSDV